MLSEFERKITDFVKANNLFASAEKVLLAVSGGADSTALLYVMRRLLDEGVFRAELRCAHINHQLRGCEADLDEQFVIGQAGELNLPIITKRVDVQRFARCNKLSIETSARKLRIEGLLDIAKVHHCNLIATAHQKNDNAETILHRLLRGTGFRGLAGIWPVQAFDDGVKFVRPLLCVRRDEIIGYLQQRNLKWREDHTNADCTYTRNYIRHRLLPALQTNYTGSPREIDDYDLSHRVKETNYLTGSIVEDLSLLAQQGRKLNCLVRQQAEKIWPELARSGENNVVLNLKGFLAKPKIVRVELIRRSITGLGCGERNLTQRHYERILQLAEPAQGRAGNKKLELPGGFVVRRESGNLVFAQPEKNPPPDRGIIENVQCEVPGQTRFGLYLVEATTLDAFILRSPTENGECFRLRRGFGGQAMLDARRRRESRIENRASSIGYIERFDLDRIKLPLVVRLRRKGDRFWPLGLAAEKKVGKFLTGVKVPQEIRNKTVIIADSEKIIWVWPIRISEQVKVTAGTRKILQLQINDNK
jgi:tRNA(Ile)-lysidine synthase